MKRHFFLTLSVMVGFWICQNSPADAQVQGNSVSRGPQIGLRQPGQSVLSTFRDYSSSVEFNSNRYSRTQANPLSFNQRNARSRINRGTPSTLSRQNRLRPNTVSARLGPALIRPGGRGLDNLLTSRPTMHSSRALAKSRIASVGNQLGSIAPIRPTNTQTGYRPKLFMPSLSLSQRGTLSVKPRLSKRKTLSRRMSLVEVAQKEKIRKFQKKKLFAKFIK